MTDEEQSAHYLLLKGIISAGLVGVGFLSGGALSGLVAGFVGSVGARLAFSRRSFYSPGSCYV
jgi:hypothetical protein